MVGGYALIRCRKFMILILPKARTGTRRDHRPNFTLDLASREQSLPEYVLHPMVELALPPLEN